jgi:polyhydroxyalkanoate synthesis regulator phasin
MKITLGRLRNIFAEARVTASIEYMRKERIREHVQSLIIETVKSGEINDQNGIDDFCKSAKMALSALEMVPFEVWLKLSDKKMPKK